MVRLSSNTSYYVRQADNGILPNRHQGALPREGSLVYVVESDPTCCQAIWSVFDNVMVVV